MAAGNQRRTPLTCIKHATHRDSNTQSCPFVRSEPGAGANAACSAAHTLRTRSKGRLPFLSDHSLVFAASVSRLAREKKVPRPQPSSAHGRQCEFRLDTAPHAYCAAPSLHARFWRATNVPAPPRCITTAAGCDRSPDVRSQPVARTAAGFTYTKTTCTPVNPMVRITCCDAWGDRRHSREVLYESTWLRVLTSQVR